MSGCVILDSNIAARKNGKRLPCGALQAENARLRGCITKLEQANIVLDSDNTELRNDMRDMQMIVSENAKLREQIERLQPKDCEGNALGIADTVHMLRSEHDGDHEWDDVVVELVLTKWGGDRWIVRGSKGEAWACDCRKTGYDEDAYEGSDDAEPIANPSLAEAENAKLRTALTALLQCSGITKRDKGCEACPMYDKEREYVWVGDWCGLRRFIRKLGIEVD